MFELRNLLKYSISAAFFSFYAAQAQILPPLEYYIDDQERLFWPRTKPLYLFVTDNSEGNDPERIKSQSSPEYADPIYLPKEGLNIIASRYAVKDGRTVQPLQEVMFEIYGDGIPPKTRVQFVAPTYRNESTVFYGQDLKITATSSDTTSGVKAVYYSYLESDFSLFGGSYATTNEGRSSFKIYALDYVNNAETVQEYNFIIDLTAPETKHTISGTFRGRILSPEVEIKLEAIDRSSGVKATFYQIDNGPQRAYTQPIPVSSLPDGDHTIRYFSEDHVKNSETPVVFDFYLDKTPPVIEVKIIGDQYQNRGRMFISDRTNIEFTATDNKAGVGKIFYRVDGGDEKVYREPFLLEKGTGNHIIRYYSSDQVGNGMNGEWNEENGGRKGLDIDMNAPTIANVFEGKTFSIRDTTYIRGDTKIKLSATDAESGIKKIGYKVNGGSGLDYDAGLVYPDEGFYLIDYYATDYVNNRNSKEFSFVVDNTGPVVSYSFSSRSTQTKTIDGQPYSIYQSGVKLFLQAIDLATDTQDILYSINGNPEASYQKPIALTQAGALIIKVSAVDRLGNKCEPKSIQVFIQN